MNYDNPYYIEKLRIKEEKRKQEMASLLKIDDSFRKIIITEDLVKRHMDENGVEWVNVYDFLKSEDL